MNLQILKNRVSIGLGLFAILAASWGHVVPALAQEVEPALVISTDEAVDMLRGLRNINAAKFRRLSIGADSSTDGQYNNPFVLEAGEDGSQGKITWYAETDCTKDKDEKCTAEDFGFSASLSAPLNKTTERSDFTNLDGLAKDISLSVQFNFPLQRRTTDQEIMAATKRISTGEQLNPQFVAEDATNRGVATLDLAQIRADEDIRQYLDSPLVTWFGGATISTNDYDYFDLEQEKQNDREYGAEAKFGRAWITDNARMSVSVSYERSFQDSKTKAQLCTAIENTQSLETCQTLPLGSPERINSTIARMEYRRVLPEAITKWVGVDLAISPLISHDFRQDVTGIELPFYWLRNKDGDFTGGLRMGWRSDTDNVSVSLFVAKALSFKETPKSN
jgi:hypothetical protein